MSDRINIYGPCIFGYLIHKFVPTLGAESFIYNLKNLQLTIGQLCTVYKKYRISGPVRQCQDV